MSRGMGSSSLSSSGFFSLRRLRLVDRLKLAQRFRDDAHRARVALALGELDPCGLEPLLDLLTCCSAVRHIRAISAPRLPVADRPHARTPSAAAGLAQASMPEPSGYVPAGSDRWRQVLDAALGDDRLDRAPSDNGGAPAPPRSGVGCIDHDVFAGLAPAASPPAGAFLERATNLPEQRAAVKYIFLGF